MLPTSSGQPAFLVPDVPSSLSHAISLCNSPVLPLLEVSSQMHAHIPGINFDCYGV